MPAARGGNGPARFSPTMHGPVWSRLFESSILTDLAGRVCDMTDQAVALIGRSVAPAERVWIDQSLQLSPGRSMREQLADLARKPGRPGDGRLGRLGHARTAGGKKIPVEMLVACIDEPAAKGYRIAVYRIDSGDCAEEGSDEELTELLNQTPNGVIVQRDGEPLFVNQTLAEMLGYDSPEEIDNVHRLFGDLPIGDPNDELNGDGSGQFELARKDGDTIVAELVPSAIKWKGAPAVATQVCDVTERIRLERTQQKEGELDRLVAELSSHLTSLDLEQADAAIQDSLRMLAEHTGVDLCVFARRLRDRDRFVVDQWWSNRDLSISLSRARSLPLDRLLPWTIAQTRSNEVVDIHGMHRWPAGAATERRLMARLGLNAALSLPIVARGEAQGLIAFASVERLDGWSGERVQKLKMIGEKIFAVIERAAARDEQRRLLAILEATPDFIATTSHNGSLSYVNEAARRMMGFAREEDLSRHSILEFIPASGVQHVDGTADAAETYVNEKETEFLSSDGDIVPVSEVVITHPDSAGSSQCFSVIARDITHMRQAEARLRDSERKFRAVFDQASQMIGLLTPDGTIMDLNRTAKTWISELGYPRRGSGAALPPSSIGDIQRVMRRNCAKAYGAPPKVSV